VLENSSGTAAILQIDQDGIANGAHWTTTAQLDGVHTGDGVKVIFDTSQPAATLTVPALILTHNHDFNGDGLSDLLWRHTGGTFTEWQSNGSGFSPNVAVNSTVDNSWHLEGAFDFSGDGQADLLWRNDASGTFTIWDSTGNGFAPNLRQWQRR
jgi:hypothetical protein